MICKYSMYVDVHSGDVIIEFPVGDCSTFATYRVREAIPLGYNTIEYGGEIVQKAYVAFKDEKTTGVFIHVVRAAGTQTEAYVVPAFSGDFEIVEFQE